VIHILGNGKMECPTVKANTFTMMVQFRKANGSMIDNMVMEVKYGSMDRITKVSIAMV